MQVFKVLTPGAYTTVQDLGRPGLQRMGVPLSGALDQSACQIANLLVGNPVAAAVLEITVIGPRLEFICDADIALTGADMGLTRNGDALRRWCSHHMRAGDILEIHQVKSGCRAYLAIGGGIDVPQIMGSRATYVGGGIGGFKGRQLQTGDILARCPAPVMRTTRRLPDAQIPFYGSEIVLRAVPGPQDDFFDQGLRTLFEAPYMVTAKADRMGYRLQGPAIEPLPEMPASIISEPSMPGAIQIPADHQPIVLFVEQTVGGYTKIATVISGDLPRLAQATPGDTVRFESVDLQTAHDLYHAKKQWLQSIATAFEAAA